MYDQIIKRNNCYRIDARFENLISSGADKKVIGFEIAFGRKEYNNLLKGDNPVEAICDCALDILEASKKVLRDPATKKAVQIAVGLSFFLLCNDLKHFPLRSPLRRGQLSAVSPAPPSLSWALWEPPWTTRGSSSST